MNYDLLAALMDSALLCRLFNNLLHFKFNPKLRYISGVTAMIMLTLRYFICLNVSENTEYSVRIVFNLAIFFIAFVFYADSIRKKILISFIYFVLMIISESVVMIIVTLATQQTIDYVIENNEAIRQACIFISKLLAFYLVEQLIVRFRVYRDVTFNYMKELTVILGFNFILFAFAIRVITYPEALNTNYQILLILTIGITFVSLLSTYLISKVAQKSRKEMEYQLELNRLEMENKYYEDMSNIVGNLRSLRHDMNNHIGIMLGLVKTKSYVDLKEYLDDIYADARDANDYIFLEDRALTILLNTKIGKATNLNIDMDIDITISSLPFNSKDMSTIIGNMLDNAIEAASKVKEQPFISLTMKKYDKYYTICCRNNFEFLPKEEDGRFLTTKKDTANHGMGISNIKSAMEHYNGKVSITITDVFEMLIEVEDRRKDA